MLKKIRLYTIQLSLCALVSIFFAAEKGVAATFAGTTDEGIPVACRGSASQLYGKPGSFSCKFRAGASSIRALAGDSPVSCSLDSQGLLEDCLPRSYALKEFYIWTSSVRTGLMSCRTDFRTLNDLNQLDCSESYNPGAGIFGTDQDRQNVVTCRGEDNLMVLVDQVTADHSGSGALWLKGDYGVVIYDGYSRAVEAVGVPMERLESTEASIFKSKSESILLTFKAALHGLQPGEKVSAEMMYNGSKSLSCVVGKSHSTLSTPGF